MTRSALFVVYATVFLDLLGFGILLPALPYYAKQLGAHGTTLGILFSAYSVAQMIGSNLLGRVSDRVGRRPVLLVSLAGSAISMTLSGFARSLLQLGAARSVAGLAGGSISTAQAYIADSTRPEERAPYMGMLGASIGLGFVAGPVLGALLIARGHGFAGAAFTSAGLAAANWLLALFTLKESPHRVAGAGHRGLGAWLAAFSRPSLPPLLLAGFFTMLAFVGMETTFAFWVDSRFGIKEKGLGLLLGYLGVVMILVQGGMIRPLTRRFGVQPVAFAGALLLAASLASLPFSPTLGVAMAVMAFLAAGQGLANPSLATLLSQAASADEQGTVLGAGQSSAALARAVGPLLAGTLYDLGQGWPYWAAALLAVVAATLVKRTRPVEQAVPG